MESGTRPEAARPLQQLLEEQPDLESGQRRPRQKCVPNPNEMWWFGCPGDVEDSGCVEVPGVPVGRGVHEHELITGVHGPTAELDVLGGDPAHVVDRRDPADELLDGDREVGAVAQRCHCSGWRAISRMMRAMTVRVVSAPPSSSSSESLMTSSTPNWWPGTSAVVQAVMTSSAGQRCFSS
jgi:hypothetical protein